MENISIIPSTILNSKKDPWGGMTVFVLLNRVVRGVEMNIPVKMDKQNFISDLVQYINHNETRDDIYYLFRDYSYMNNEDPWDYNIELSVTYIINQLYSLN
jgi:hypothetical protein